MKRRQKLSHFLVLTLCIILLSGSAYANPVDKLDAIDLQLIKIGIPIELINEMDIYKKKDIAENTIEFISSETTYFDENGDIIEITSGEPSTMGTIPTANFSLTISVLRSANSSDNRERLTAYVDYDWLKIPAMQQDDPFGIAWDNSRWRAVDNTTSQSLSWKNLFGVTERWSDTSIAYSSDTGVGWNAELWRTSGQLLSLYGWGKVQIESLTPGSISGTDQVLSIVE